LIVPHGPLHYLPFAALQDGTQTLLASRSLRFLPSTSVQKYIRPHSQTGAGKMLIFGNPDLGNAKFDLPSAEEEAKTIAALLPDRRILTRKQATETAFKAQARDFNFLHIASHGQFKSDNALESRLLLAPDSSNDGSLTVNELYSSALNADLVTLSACETGLGKTLSGDDVLGLNRGFLYAGASNIVSSLWEVDDEATSQLMQAFYRQLKNGSTKQEALRQAQLQLRKNFPDPIFWAAFYLTGEGI
ncbi:MAG: CHAT domain-containing protein, partial [Rhodocyclales bacterium]|nr:CHAT domain-containing protein [Rhodocyclales bacterium]